MTEFSAHTPDEEIRFSQSPENSMPIVDNLANYEGSWFNLQSERMQTLDFRLKFLNFLAAHTNSLTLGSPATPLDKTRDFQSHYVDQSINYDRALEHVTAAVSYGPVNEVGGSNALDLGHGNIGQQGTVYVNARSKKGDVPLNDKQKDIIAAHEAYHGLVDARGSAIEAVHAGFDWARYNEIVESGEVSRPQYLRNADELMARMAQFKNYFGMMGDEQFTKTHLDYLRDNYITDTGLDNHVSTMLEIVTASYEDRFLSLMNTLPV